jgi:Xaa-Pro aminopeptidase
LVEMIRRQAYKEILFLPTRNLRTELYTGAKMDAATAGVVQATGVDEVEPMTAMPTELNKVVARDRRLASSLWTQPDSQPAKAVVTLNAATLGMDAAPPARDVTRLTMPLREVKDDGEIELLKKASDASIAAQRAMMRATTAGVTERTLAGR